MIARQASTPRARAKAQKARASRTKLRAERADPARVRAQRRLGNRATGVLPGAGWIEAEGAGPTACGALRAGTRLGVSSGRGRGEAWATVAAAAGLPLLAGAGSSLVGNGTTLAVAALAVAALGGAVAALGGTA